MKMTTAFDELSIKELYTRREYLLKQIKRIDDELEIRKYENNKNELCMQSTEECQDNKVCIHDKVCIENIKEMKTLDINENPSNNIVTLKNIDIPIKDIEQNTSITNTLEKNTLETNKAGENQSKKHIIRIPVKVKK
jgi:hypothetical protein